MNKTIDYRLIQEQEAAKVDFAIMLENVLKQNGINYSELARRTGKSKSLISRIMGGNNNLTIETMASLLFAVDEKLVISTEKKLLAEYNRMFEFFDTAPLQMPNAIGGISYLAGDFKLFEPRTKETLSNETSFTAHSPG